MAWRPAIVIGPPMSGKSMCCSQSAADGMMLISSARCCECEGLDGNGNAVGIDDDRPEMAHGFLNSFAVMVDRAVREEG